MKTLIPSPNRVVFYTQLLVLSLLALWRIGMSCGEYDHGPFLSLSRSFLDQAAFWALLLFVLAGYSRWLAQGRRATLCLVAGAGLLCVTAGDLVWFNGNARENLYTGSWSGQAYLSFDGERPWDWIPRVNVTFTQNGQAVILMDGGVGEIHKGQWDLAFDPLRCSQVLTLPGFGRGDYWNNQDLHLTGSFVLRKRVYRLTAQLRPVRKNPA